MEAKFIGDGSVDHDDLPKVFNAFGVEFPRGKFVPIPAEPKGVREKIAANSHYEVKGVPKDVQTHVDAVTAASDADRAEAAAAEEAQNAAYRAAQEAQAEDAPRRGPGRPPKG